MYSHATTQLAIQNFKKLQWLFYGTTYFFFSGMIFKTIGYFHIGCLYAIGGKTGFCFIAVYFILFFWSYRHLRCANCNTFLPADKSVLKKENLLSFSHGEWTDKDKWRVLLAPQKCKSCGICLTQPAYLYETGQISSQKLEDIIFWRMYILSATLLPLILYALFY